MIQKILIAMMSGTIFFGCFVMYKQNQTIVIQHDNIVGLHQQIALAKSQGVDLFKCARQGGQCPNILGDGLLVPGVADAPGQ